MKMVNRVAFQNMKYHKSKNILVGIAIFLTTLLLFLIPTVGRGIISLQFAMIDELYPTYHAFYRGVDQNQVKKLSKHHDVEEYGLRSDVGNITASNADISLTYLDQKAFELSHLELTQGSLPEQENEIVLTEGILKELGEQGNIGASISIPFQIYRNGYLDYEQKKEFVISGLIKDSDTDKKNKEADGIKNKKAYSAFISKAFLETEVPQEQIIYSFLFRVNTQKDTTTDKIEDTIYHLAKQMDIPEQRIHINSDYLAGHYVDPSFATGIAVIMCIVIFAGIITLYSIYYVGMPQRIQELGRLKAIGATRRQLKQIIFREGLAVAGIAIPVALLSGSFLTSTIFRFLGKTQAIVSADVINRLIRENTVHLLYPPCYLLAIAVTLLTVWLSLYKPMKIAAKVSEIDAIRQHTQSTKPSKKLTRKSFHHLSIPRLARIYTLGNKKNALITIGSMSVTGMFTIVLSTILSCATPVDSANQEVYGQYQITVLSEEGNKEHPEWKWSNVIRNNPLNDGLISKLEAIDGVNHIEPFQAIAVIPSDHPEYQLSITGVAEKCTKDLLDGIVEGKATAKQLASGNCVILNKLAMQWYPEIKLGDTIQVEIQDGVSEHKKEVKVIAIGDYSIGFSEYNCLLTTSSGMQKLSSYNTNTTLHIFTDDKDDRKVTRQIAALANKNDRLELTSWQNSYETWRSTLSFTGTACYIFLGILGTICIMNIINTMIHSVHIRKKELGMIQAIGMSDYQLTKMLQLEGLFYTITTLATSIGLGSLLGYPVFLWAKKDGILNIRQYHYPVNATIITSIILLLVQLILAVSLSKAAKKESLIERIRHSE